MEYTDSLAVTDVGDMVDYIYSLSCMTSLSSVPKGKIREALLRNMTGGILNVPKEYGMFIASQRRPLSDLPPAHCPGSPAADR